MTTLWNEIPSCLSALENVRMSYYSWVPHVDKLNLFLLVHRFREAMMRYIHLNLFLTKLEVLNEGCLQSLTKIVGEMD